MVAEEEGDGDDGDRWNWGRDGEGSDVIRGDDRAGEAIEAGENGAGGGWASGGGGGGGGGGGCGCGCGCGCRWSEVDAAVIAPNSTAGDVGWLSGSGVTARMVRFWGHMVRMGAGSRAIEGGGQSDGAPKWRTGGEEYRK